MVIQCFSCVHIMAFSQTRVIKLLFPQYGIIWNSCLFIMVCFKTHAHSHFHPILCDYIFFIHPGRSTSPDFTQSLRVVDSFFWPYTNIFFNFLLFDTHKLFQRALVFSSFAICLKMGLQGSSGWKQLIHCMEFMLVTEVFKVSIVRIILFFNVWFVWNQKRFGSLTACKTFSAQYNGQFKTLL